MSTSQNGRWYSPIFSLRWRLALVYSALFGIFVTLLSILLYSSTSSLLLRNAQAAFPQHASELRMLLIQENCDTVPPRTSTVFLQQNTANDIDAIYLLDTHGKVIASSDGDLLHSSFPYVKPAFFANASSGATQSFQARISHGQNSDGLLFSLQAPANCLTRNSLPGYMAVLTSYASEQATLRTILFLVGTSSTIMIVAGALIISFFTGIMFNPLKQVTRATRELTQGNLQQRVPLAYSRDEISALALSFNQMADRIEHMFAAQQASERRARRFVSDASHELRTPITSLRGFTEVLIRGAKDDPATAQRVLGLMKNEAERMTQLVNDLLTLARLDEGHFPAAVEIDLVDVAVTCLQQVRKQASEDCKFMLELATQERLSIQANSEPLRQMLLVLLDNATKYGCTSEQKKILLRLDKKSRHALIQVVDYGVGISPDDLPHVFDRFYRGENAHSSSSSPIPGTGLGLPIAMAIAQAYQGTITVYSERGQETVFTVAFPLIE